MSIRPPTPRLTGTTLKHYRVLDILGEGGTAVVYRAEDLTLGRLVALKLLPAAITGNLGAIARFQHEARTISTLTHPNICTVYEIGEHDGRHFIVMEYLEGRPLSRVIDDRAIEPYRLTELAIQIADGLEAAHDARVIHRDLKPANIQVSPRDHVTLLDFGLATLLPFGTDATADAPWLTHRGGTDPYMSPEQARGEPLDTRSDLFSFGVVLYEMATGIRPNTGPTTAPTPDGAGSGRPMPPRDLNTAVPEALDRIITKALEPQRKLRYQTASDMAVDLRRLKRDLDTHQTPVAIPPTRTASAAAAAPRREPGSRVFGGRLLEVAGGAAIGGIVVSLALPALVEWHVTRAVVPRAVALASRAVVTNEPAPARTGSVGPGPGPTTAATREQARTEIGPDAPGETTVPLSSASAPVVPAPPIAARDVVVDALRIADAKAALQLYDQAMDTLQSAVASAPDSRSAPAAYLRMASIHESQGAADEAIAAYLEAATRYPKDAAAPEALFRMAGAIQETRRKDRDAEARAAYADIVTRYPQSPFAARALMARATLEDRGRLTIDDPRLGRRVPASVESYREVIERHPRSPEREHALWHLASRYEDLEAWVDAAAALEELGTRYPGTSYDAWFAAGEIVKKRLKDPSRAQAAFARVPERSPRYKEAQKRVMMP